MVESIFSLIRDLMKNSFYGELVIKFLNGKITVVYKTESLKLKES